jgi:gamma-glutamyltranspeptidase/glutathione hydrolase
MIRMMELMRVKSLQHAAVSGLALIVLCSCQQERELIAPPPIGMYRNGAVACDHILASEAGVEMLRMGGNAVDAAVAASFTLSVVRPYSCGIGGGGFMMIYTPATEENAAQCIALNYRETAPEAIDPQYYVRLRDDHGLEDASTFGHHAVAVPGTVAGLLYALEEFGTLDRATVMAPAIRAAKREISVDADYRLAYDSVVEWSVGRDAAGRFTPFADGHERVPIARGPRIANPAQARALELIVRDGASAFYEGDIARAMIEDMRANGGALTYEDLASYRVRREEALVGSFLGNTVFAMPLPSSGGITMLQMFGMIERRINDAAPKSHTDDAYIQLIVESMKHAFADRATCLADAAFEEVPVRELLAPSYLDTLAARIDLDRTQESMAYGCGVPLPEDGGTSHLSVIDATGMTVACTETINLLFGSRVVVPEYGFCLNNEMDDFTTIPGGANAFGLLQSDRNLPAPGKRPLSSMSPTIVVRDGMTIATAGASGGPRIINGTMQVLLNALVFGMDARTAVEMRRVHHQWMPDVAQYEPRTMPRVIQALESRGHETAERPRVGVVQVILRFPDGTMHPASDPRKGGRAAGY